MVTNPYRTLLGGILSSIGSISKVYGEPKIKKDYYHDFIEINSKVCLFLSAAILQTNNT